MSIGGIIRNKVAGWVLAAKSISQQIGGGTFSVKLITDELTEVFAYWSEYSESSLMHAFHRYGEVYAPINHIAGRVANGKWVLKKIKDDSIVTDNKYFNRIFTQPNPFQTFSEFIYENIVYELASGNAFLYANCWSTADNWNYVGVSTLINVPSDQVAIRVQPIIKLLTATEKTDIIQYYNVTAGTGMYNIDPKYILHHKQLSLKTYDYRLRGISPLRSAGKALDNLDLVYGARNKVYKNGGALGVLMSARHDAQGTRPFTPEERKDIEDQWYAKHGLTDGKRPVAISNAPVKYEKIGAHIGELQPFEETEADAAVIFGVFKVPRELMPSRQPATYDNQASAEKGLYNNTVIPMAQAKASALTDFLGFREAGFYIDVTFDHVPILQENRKEKAEVDFRNNETYKSRFLNGVITLNQWRAAVKLEPVKNAMYDKLTYDMTPEELDKVKEIASMQRGGSRTSSGTPDNQNSNSQQ
ncbi:COG4695 Phage-related protein [uncultured Caudovirales phage]|uniref:COG4695 Phage-related protein n=1 Tax=uncultured Caudovirales phage TaxID=2100421 RepID=A0A6J5KZW6_9CAUD|nr:COG4695 Phage-related protein [uncultured Caudovirales phage]